MPEPRNAYSQEICRLRAENEALREELRQLRCEIAAADSGADVAQYGRLRLSNSQARILHLLMSRRLVTKALIAQALYHDRLDAEPGPKVLFVFISHIRARLRPLGVSIASMTNVGWYMDEASKARVRALLTEEACAA